jgi:hypothetical protein
MLDGLHSPPPLVAKAAIAAFPSRFLCEARPTERLRARGADQHIGNPGRMALGWHNLKPSEFGW